MTSNELPKQLDQVFTLAEDMADGLHVHEVPVGVKQNTETVIRAALSAAKIAEATFQAKRAAKVAAVTAQTVADSNGRAFIGKAKKVLSTYIGDGWSVAWATAGFVNESTAIPGTIAERQACLGALQQYFTANPAQQNAQLQVTAAKAGTFFTALSDKRSAANAALQAVGTAKAARDAAVSALRKRMTALIGELALLLKNTDPLWYAFGLNAPGDSDMPEIPEGLVLTAGQPGNVLADWADARRAVRYRVWKKIVGVDADFVAVESREVSDTTLTGLPSGATVEIRITAVNDKGAESQPSETKSIVVP